jgi:tetratricopeptide (TPR) repeat protein
VDIAYSLVEKSLLTVSGDAQPQFGMLETIRAYGRERLAESGVEGQVIAAYVRHFTELAEQAEPNLRTRDQLVWLDRLRAEHDNLHQALRFAITTGDLVGALRLVAGLGSYWWLGGHRAEGADLAEEVVGLAEAGGGLDQHLLAQVRAVSSLNVIDGNRPFPQIRAWIDETAALAERVERDTQALRIIGPLRDMVTAAQVGEAAVSALSTLVDDPDPWVRATGRLLRAHSVLNLGRDLADAEADLRLSLRDFTALGERWGLSSSLAALADETSRDGDHEQAAAMWAEAVTYLEELGSLEDVPHFLFKFAREQWLAGDPAAAHRTLDRGAAVAEAIGSRESMAVTLVERAELLRNHGDADGAATELDRGLALLATVNPAPQLSAVAHSVAGMLARGRGDLAAARVEHEQALEFATVAMDSPVIARTVVGAADLAAAEGRYAKAAALLGAAAGIRGAPDRAMPDLPRLERLLRDELGDAAFEESYLDGRATAVDGRLPELL